ncbi:MAG: L-seryl-tRNA(Sec) selenium transferase [Rhodospirillales bacterium]
MSARPDYSGLPAVDSLLRHPGLKDALENFGDALVTEVARDVISRLRKGVPDGIDIPPHDEIAANVARQTARLMSSNLRPVFNLTGTVIHTNLGRAPLAPEAVEAMKRAAGAAALEFDVDSGKRGDRDSIVEEWLIRLTGAEAATVVNNNAAAVMLVLNTLSEGHECIVSRGELIEIGGAFRMPDIMSRAGAVLREVGTTNRTHLRDYENAAGPETAMMMKVHTSNFVVQGFTKMPAETEIAGAAKAAGVPFVNDLGSGMLIDLAAYGLPHEPTPAEAIRDGADIVTFSGDKLLGGPQAGLIVGRADLIQKLKKNPLKRALRLDKMTLAALEATLQIYANPAKLVQRLPTLRLLTRPAADIAGVASRMAGAIAAELGDLATVDCLPCHSQIGSGSLPVDLLESTAIRIIPAGPQRGAGGRLEALGAAFRSLPAPVIGRIADGALLLDCRCLEDEAGFTKQLSCLAP